MSAETASVLLVDDSPDTRRFLTLLLKRWGYRVECAASGGEAIELVGQAVPDLIILDVMMPDMDGMEVLRRLRSEPSTSDVPVILHTAISDLTTRESARRQGATDFWVKAGTSADEMRDAIARHLG